MVDNVKADKPWNMEPTEPLETMEAEGVEAPSYEKEYVTVGRSMERQENSVCYLITSNCLGDDESMGVGLMQQFIQSMASQKLFPNYVLFVNTGVYLTLQDSAVTGDLLDFYDSGTILMSSAESLDFFGMRNKVAVGQVAGADEMAMILHSVDKVVTL